MLVLPNSKSVAAASRLSQVVRGALEQARAKVTSHIYDDSTAMFLGPYRACGYDQDMACQNDARIRSSCSVMALSVRMYVDRIVAGFDYRGGRFRR